MLKFHVNILKQDLILCTSMDDPLENENYTCPLNICQTKEREPVVEEKLKLVMLEAHHHIIHNWIRQKTL